MRYLKLAVVVGALSLVVGRPGFLRPQAADFTLEPNIESSTDPCRTTERCVVVYVAPWCSACKQALGLIRELRRYTLGSDGKVGMRIITGLSDPSDLGRYANEIGGQVFFDPSGAYYDAMGGSGVPAWWVLDEKQRIVTHYSGYVSGAPMDMLVDEMVDNQLGLSKFM